MRLRQNLIIALFIFGSLAVNAEQKKEVDYGLRVNNVANLSALDLAALTNLLLTGGTTGFYEVNCKSKLYMIKPNIIKNSIQIWASMSCFRFSMEGGVSPMDKEEIENEIVTNIKPKIDDLIPSNDYVLKLNIRPKPSVGASN